MESSEKLLPHLRAGPTAAAAAVPFSKAMANELSQKQPPSVLDRFKALLKQREEGSARVSSDDDDSSNLTTEEVVQLYEVVLAELTFNSKPIITDLTIIAGEHRDHAQGIADAICSRILEVPVDQKLPSLYLLDSIVKNIGREYVRYFLARLPEVFCQAYRQVHPSMYSSMRHLFRTWSTVFPPSVLRKIEAQLQFSPQANNQGRASESPRPTHGIHVNPKYLRQLEHSTADDVGAQRLSTAGPTGRTPLPIGANKLPLSSASRLSKPVASSTLGAERPISSEINDFPTGNSPRRFVEGASPSHQLFDYGHLKAIGRDEETNDWKRKRYSEDNIRFEVSVPYSLSNGHEHERPRALIDAYGDDRRKRIPTSKALQSQYLDVNGTGSKPIAQPWQNTEEEEFDWEDMSPTLADRGRVNDFLPSSAPSLGTAGTRPVFGRPAATQLGSDIRSNCSSQTQLLPMDSSSNIAEDEVPILGSTRGLAGKALGFQTDRSQMMGSHFPQEPWNHPHQFPQSTSLLKDKRRGRDGQLPVSASSLSSSGVVSSSTGAWPPMNVHKSYPPPSRPIFPPQKQSGSQFDPVNASGSVINHGFHKLSSMSEQQFNNFENKQLLPNQHAVQLNPLRPHFLQSHEAQEKFPLSAGASVPPHPLTTPLNHGYSTQGHGAALNISSNPLPVVQLPLPVNSFQNTFHPQMGPRPPVLPGPPPASQVIPNPQNAGMAVPNQQPSSAFSGLISSLMAQGLISLTNQIPLQDSVGLEFNADLLKVRHESAISMLYSDLPRQCTTCGLRFKCQEEHSSHMDWHVTKNRMSKNRKQKPSRKWFVSANMWLSGAEALGTDAIPGFLPTETIAEKKDDEELAVPADEEQNACALCGEPFDDFYSDETEEWMYRGAVYLNAPNGFTADMDRSQLGPIVHAKCRSDSSVAPPENFGQNGGGNTEEGSQRKQMRS